MILVLFAKPSMVVLCLSDGRGGRKMPFHFLMLSPYYVGCKKSSLIMQAYTQASHPCEMCTTQ